MIENGEIGIVIVKDMSRLGRNYLQVGMYTDVIFPNNNVRFIAVNDNVDSAVQTEFDMTPIRNFCNELYARDTAKKITSSFRIKGEQGRHLSVNPPFGYVKDEKEKNNWLIDEEAAKIVRYIFRLCAEGFGPSQIANRLRKEKVLTPTAYKKQKKGEMLPKEPFKWEKGTIARILEHIDYLGHTENFKTRKQTECCLKIPTPPLLMKTPSISCRRYAAISTDQPRQEKSVYFRARYFVLTAGQSYISTQQISQRKIRTRLPVPTTAAIQALAQHIISEM